MLGARLRVEEADDVAAATVTRRELGSTYLLMGTPRPRRGLGRPGVRAGGDGADPALLTRLLKDLPGVDVRIVADPTLRGGRAAAPSHPDGGRAD
jgi:hypothetical protein